MPVSAFPVTARLDNPSGDWSGGEKAILTVTWEDAVEPCTLFAEMGHGTTRGIYPALPATSPFTHEFILVEHGPCEFKVRVYDAEGNPGYTTGEYSVLDSWNPPQIDSIEFSGNRLDVQVSDADSTRLVVKVTEIENLRVDDDIKWADANGLAKFYWSKLDGFIGGQGDTVITVSDEVGDSAPAACRIALAYDSWQAPGTLAALPLQSTVHVGETVTVVVSAPTGFAADAPLAYLNGVAVTVEPGGHYVSGTFNVGAVGGDNQEPDGIWATLERRPLAFFTAEEFMMQAKPVDDSARKVFLTFNVTPVCGGETTAAGDLFNFGIAFDQTGTYRLGFIKFHEVKRTYYSDDLAAEHNFGDVYNRLPGQAATITVVP